MLTEREIGALKPKAAPYRVADGQSLFIQVTPNNTKLWRMRYRWQGAEKTLALGRWPDTGGAAARRAAGEARQLLQEGQDPGAVRRQAKEVERLGQANSFRVVAEDWAARVKVKLAAKTQAKHEGFMRNWIYPAIGDVPIGQLAAADVVRLLRKIERSGAMEVAARVFNIVGRVCRYAVALGLADRDPTRDLSLTDLIHRAPVQNRAALTSPEEVGKALRAIWGYDGSPVVRAALMLSPLVFTRPGELRLARWADFDLEKGEWRYFVTKTRIDHLVPLSPVVLDILRQLKALTGDSEFLFPNLRHRDRAMSDNALNAAIRALGYDTRKDFTSHGWRATARTLLAEELGFDPLVIEHQLAHKVPDALGTAYNRTKYLKERKPMMDRWSAYLMELKDGPALKLAA